MDAERRLDERETKRGPNGGGPYRRDIAFRTVWRRYNEIFCVSD